MLNWSDKPNNYLIVNQTHIKWLIVECDNQVALIII